MDDCGRASITKRRLPHRHTARQVRRMIPYTLSLRCRFVRCPSAFVFAVGMESSQGPLANLPLELVARIARGRDELKQLRLVSRDLREGFDLSVKCINIYPSPTYVPPRQHAKEQVRVDVSRQRFPILNYLLFKDVDLHGSSIGTLGQCNRLTLVLKRTISTTCFLRQLHGGVVRLELSLWDTDNRIRSLDGLAQNIVKLEVNFTSRSFFAGHTAVQQFPIINHLKISSPWLYFPYGVPSCFNGSPITRLFLEYSDSTHSPCGWAGVGNLFPTLEILSLTRFDIRKLDFDGLIHLESFLLYLCFNTVEEPLSLSVFKDMPLRYLYLWVPYIEVTVDIRQLPIQFFYIYDTAVIRMAWWKNGSGGFFENHGLPRVVVGKQYGFHKFLTELAIQV